MPDLPNRKRIEGQVKAAFKYVWKACLKAIPSGIAAINRAMKQALGRYVRPVMEAVYRKVQAFLWAFFIQLDEGSILGMPESKPDRVSAEAKKLAKRHVDRLGRQMSETNAKRWEEMPAGVDPEEWAEDNLFTEDRAEQVAITEPTVAVTQAETAVAEKVGRKLGEVQMIAVARWRTALDDRVCPVCRPLEGTYREEWGEDFKSGPPAHIRCRCYLEWRLMVDPDAGA